MSETMAEKSNFILAIINRDLQEGTVDTVHTRFPPEPNGYCTRACQGDLAKLFHRPGLRGQIQRAL